jgi:hypothetical protein
MKTAFLLFWLCLASAALADENVLRVSTFRADVTPPLGPVPAMGILPQATSIEHPLEARGVVLQFGGATHVLTAIDYCGLCNSSHEIFRQKIAAAVGAKPDFVVLQALHQHTAPVLDVDGARILYQSDPATLKLHLRFTDEMADRVAEIGRAHV